MLNFRRVFEFIFSSFRISRDAEIIEQVIEENGRFALLIKRSWLFGAFSFFIFLPVAILAAANIYLIEQYFDWTTQGTVLATLIGVNVLYTLMSTLHFFYSYRKTRKHTSGISDVYTLKYSILKSDEVFTSLFNQLQTNFFLFVGVVIFYISHIVFISHFASGIWAVIDIFCILVQLFFLRRFMVHMIDFEMDFSVVIPGRLYYVNQEGMYAQVQTLDGDKIKTIKTSYPNFLASFFGYGSIDVMMEWDDQAGMGAIRIDYVSRPEEVVQDMNTLLYGSLLEREKECNVYLQKLITENELDPDGENFDYFFREVLARQETQIRSDYETWDLETKSEIEAIYREFAKN